MADYNTLIKQRAVIKGGVTRINNFVLAFNNLQSKHLLKVKAENLEKLREKYDEVQSKLEIHNDATADIIDDRETMEDAIDEIRAKIFSLQTNEINTNIPKVNDSKVLQLCPIKLPTFDGNVLQFEHFSSVFKDLVEQRDDLSKLQKLHYLISSLRGEAFNAVKTLPINNENYDVAIKLLKDRYDNKFLIATHHITNLLGIENLQKSDVESMNSFINKLSSSVNALKAMHLEVNVFELIVVQLLVNKLDFNTCKLWKEKISLLDNKFPSMEVLTNFLEQRRNLLENSTFQSSERNLSKHDGYENRSDPNINKSFNRPKQFKNIQSYHAGTPAATEPSCVYCKSNHLLYNCNDFKALPTERRNEFSKTNKLCFNCLQKNHTVDKCFSKHSCRICNKKHHTLIHFDKSKPQDCNKSESNQENNNYCALKLQTTNNILLSTAVCSVTDRWGNAQTCRVLLDSASQANFCTVNLVKRLGLDLEKNNMPISGINNSSCHSEYGVRLRLHSQYENFNFEVECAVLPNIASDLPSIPFDISTLNIPNDIFLADSKLNVPSQVDVLIGAQFYLSLLKSIKYVRSVNYPIIQETRLGFIVAGSCPMTNNHNAKSPVSTFLTMTELSTKVENFWNLEDCAITAPLSKESALCEKHFVKTTYRNEQGKFVVSLPCENKPVNLGDSLKNAENRFLSLESKLARNPKLKIEYCKFIDEYLNLNHMELIVNPDLNNGNVFYLPHHAVYNCNSTTTKLRVVFDGSAKSSNGMSLNDNLLVGPNVQQELFSIIVRFRTHNYVIISDISKMYRQVRMNPDDCDLQRIVWRNSCADKLQHYRLTTVTYGISSASYLATRCLVQIAKENKSKFPEACRAIEEDFYVDDLLTGASSIQEVQKLRIEISELLKDYGFPMHKWFSNFEVNDEQKLFSIEKDEVRTLGLIWQVKSDNFVYIFNDKQTNNVITKRFILSIVAGIYDPLGLIGPIVFQCKHFIQKLWSHNLSWDTEITGDLKNEWLAIHSSLSSISNLTVPRKVIVEGDIKNVELIGFCDASLKGFGCCLFLKTINHCGEISCHLLCSKSRLAPLKQITLPRLELCGAVLLSRLLSKVTPILNMRVDSIHLYSDSMVVLHWLKSPPSRWKIFVGNRVSEIQEKTSNALWHHVSSYDNPADVLSRGCTPDHLINHSLWWQGPLWLSKETECPQSSNVESQIESDECLREARKCTQTFVATSPITDDYTKRFSSLSKLIRVFSYCLRFISNLKSNRVERNKLPYLSCNELNNTLIVFIRLSQQAFFQTEIKNLLEGKNVSKQSKLASLNPFIDDCGILRVGGRLVHSQLPLDSKHPIIIHPHAQIASLIIESEHIRLLHGGVQLVHSSLRQRFWIINSKLLIRSIVHKCLKCFRYSCSKNDQLMGQLPAERVVSSGVFTQCGVDYGGPILIRQGGQRSKTVCKSYIVLLICLNTKAIHLEVVTDLSSQSFIAAFRRFISRRGIPSQMFSDNGTNFHGAQNIMLDLFKLFKSKDFQCAMQSFTTNQGIKWSFIPPSSPHFGGLWESGIKSAKFHLRRVIGQSILNFEEFSTVLTQIEACLNSRPLFAISSDASDPMPLTPGHFLIGRPLVALPCPNYVNTAMNRLKRWQLLQTFVASVWKRWSRDYLNQLQQRNKWKFPKRNLCEGDLVLMIDENSPPMIWKMGVVLKVYPGEDNLVRVVDVKTGNGVFRRSISKLCLLPTDDCSS